MASFNFVNTSQFRPFSYQEMLQPLAAYTQEYNAIEEGLGELGTKADVFKSLASQQNDPETYQAYMNFANELNSVANDLSNHGLNASSRRKLVDMKRRYSSDIIPIEQAFTRRKELIDEQRKARLQDDTLEYESEASTISLDDLIKDPSLSYKSFSGKNIINISSKAAAAIAKEARKDPRAWKQILDGQYYEAKMQKGATSEEVLAAMQGDINANPRLRKIIDDAVSSSRVMDWKGVKDKDGNLTEYGKNLINQVESYAGQGLWSAIGETTYKELANKGWVPTNPKKPERPSNFGLNPSNIYSNRELNEAEKTYNNNIKKFSDYFYTYGKGRTTLNERGMAEYRRNSVIKVTSAGSGSGTARLMNAETQMQKDNRFVPTEFKKFMDSLGMDPKQADIDNWNGTAIGNLWQKYVNENPEAQTAKYDAIKITEYKYSVPANEEYQNNFKSKLSEAIGTSGELEEVDYDSNLNKWVPTGKTLPFSEFDTKEYKLTSRAPSEIGTTWLIKKNGERAKRYKAVPGINTTAENGRDEILNQMITTQRMLLDPNLTPQQRIKLEDYYDDLTQQQHMFESQIDITNQTSTQNNKPYNIP